MGGGRTMSACNAVELDAPAIGLTFTADEPAAPRGGEIADGTYFMTALVAYRTLEMLTEPDIRTKVVVSGSSWEQVDGAATEGPLPTTRRSTQLLSVNGTEFTLTLSCPISGELASGSFTAEPDGFTLYLVDGGLVIGRVFTKQ
jgi:hypothetical protein